MPLPHRSTVYFLHLVHTGESSWVDRLRRWLDIGSSRSAKTTTDVIYTPGRLWAGRILGVGGGRDDAFLQDIHGKYPPIATMYYMYIPIVVCITRVSIVGLQAVWLLTFKAIPLLHTAYHDSQAPGTSRSWSHGLTV